MVGYEDNNIYSTIVLLYATVGISFYYFLPLDKNRIQHFHQRDH